MSSNLQIIDNTINNTFIDDEDFNITEKDSDRKHKTSMTSNTEKDDNIIDLDEIYNNKNTKSKTSKTSNTKKNTDATLIDIDDDAPTASRDIDDSDTATNTNTNTNIIQAIKKIGSRTFRTQIMKQYIRPRMEKDITNSISWRDKWGKISNVFFSFAEILCIIQTVLAFSASSYDLKLISYLAGMLGVLSISFNRFGTYARNASSEKTAQLNEILGTIGIKDMVPDLMDNDYGDGVKSQKSNK